MFNRPGVNRLGTICDSRAASLILNILNTLYKFPAIPIKAFSGMVRSGAVGVVIALMLVVGRVDAQEVSIDRVLAIVGEGVITLNDYRTRHRQERFENPSLAPFDGEVDPDILARMVDEFIQIDAARRRGISVSSKEIDGAVGFVAKQNGLSVAELIEQLEGQNFSYEQFRESLREQQMIRKLIDAVANSRIVVSDQEVENYLNSHEELRDFEESYEVSHLFVSTKGKSAEEVESERENLTFIREGILGGQDFATAVRSYSDASNKDEGGYLGWRTAEQLPELFVSALKAMSPGENSVSTILESDNGLHLLKLHDRKGSGNLVEQQEIQHILIQPTELNTPEDAEKLAEELYLKLQSGEPFEKLARLYSQDAQSRTNGGSLGWVNPGTLVPPFEEAARRLPLNVVSKPVQTRFGFHLIKVTGRRQSDMSSEIATNQARQAVFQRKSRDIYERWLDDLRQRTYIEYVGL